MYLLRISWLYFGALERSISVCFRFSDGHTRVSEDSLPHISAAPSRLHHAHIL
jgi:hypothetical protein